MRVIAPNTVLLRRTLAHIETHPDEFDQQVYRCETGMCFAGLACQLAGGRWAFPADSFHSQYVHAVQGDDPAEVRFIFGHRIIGAAYRARRILGLTKEQTDVLFNPENDLDGLRRIVGELCQATS